MLNSLAQTLLALTAPGVPDIYQGTELWDFSLVDPDNRRPVDYEHRRRLFTELRQQIKAAGSDRTRLVRDLLRHMDDGRVKLYVTTEGLRCRREHPGLFTTGEYVPLSTVGPRSEHVFAFLRRQGEHYAIAVVPRLLTKMVTPEAPLPIGEVVWQETELVIPNECSTTEWRHVLSGESIRVKDGKLAVADIFANCPLALLLADRR